MESADLRCCSFALDARLDGERIEAELRRYKLRVTAPALQQPPATRAPSRHLLRSPALLLFQHFPTSAAESLPYRSTFAVLRILSRKGGDFRGRASGQEDAEREEQGGGGQEAGEVRIVCCGTEHAESGELVLCLLLLSGQRTQQLRTGGQALTGTVCRLPSSA